MARAATSRTVARSRVRAERSFTPHTGYLLAFDVTVDVDVHDQLSVLLELDWNSASGSSAGPSASVRLVIGVESTARLAVMLAERAEQLRRSTL